MVDCRANPLWIQSVASAFGLYFKACPRSDAAGDVSAANGLILATPNAKAADVKTQIDNFLASGQSFGDRDLVTVMAGTHDVVEQYRLYPATPEATLLKNIEQRGKDLAAQVNRIAVTGAPVILLRIPNVGLTPYGVAQGAERAALLKRLTDAFNNALQLNIINDGHLIGLVYADTDVDFVVRNATALGLANATTPACKAAATGTDPLDSSLLLACSSNEVDLVAASAGANYYWAGHLQLGPYGQSRLGSAAASRALNNPF